MIIEPRIRGFICTTAHPLGCEAHVNQQIAYVQSKRKIKGGAQKVLVVGASTGYGLASRITVAFGCGAATLGVFFEKPAESGRTASAGWYNALSFERTAQKSGLYSKNINGDAFSNEIKNQTIQEIKKDLKKIDLFIYSLAAPLRVHPKTGEKHRSVLKPIGTSYQSKTVDANTGVVSTISIDSATPDEINQTISVMGGEDWALWVSALQEAGVLDQNFLTVAYSYIGPDLTYPIYRNGTIGRAKEDLERTAQSLKNQLKSLNGQATVSVNKALVTQASSAIPVVPLYIAILYRIMKQNNTHEGCIEQMHRLFSGQIYNGKKIETDINQRIRMDDWELRTDIQEQVKQVWAEVTTENIFEISDLKGYQQEFLKLFGFGITGVDYSADVNPQITS